MPHYERMLTDNAQLLDVATRTPAIDPTSRAAIAGFLIDVLQRPGGGFGAAQDSESWIDGARSEGGYYARGCRAPRDARRRRPSTARSSPDGTASRSARSPVPARGSAIRRSIEAARWAADAVLGANVAPDGRLVRASLDEIPSRAAATLADYGQLASGLVALAVATGEPAYAGRARDLVEACVTARRRR